MKRKAQTLDDIEAPWESQRPALVLTSIHEVIDIVSKLDARVRALERAVESTDGGAVQLIKRHVAREFGVRLDDLEIHSKSPRYTWPKQVGVYLTVHVLDLAHQAAAPHWGYSARSVGRDITHVAEICAANPRRAAQVEKLSATLRALLNRRAA